MFPLSDVIPSRTTPFVTLSLIALNALAFIYELQLTRPELQQFLSTYGAVPAEFSWVAAITSQFLHGGWIHFGSNVLCLWIFGENVEATFGHAPFLAFYLLCGVAAAAAQGAVHAESVVPVIGASGAVAAVMGGYFVLYPGSRVLTAVVALVFNDLVEVPAVVFLGLWFMLQLVSSVAPIAAHAAVTDAAVAFWTDVASFLIGAAVGAIARFTGKGYWKR